MSDVIKSWRKKYPNYGHVSDDELTWRIGSKNPGVLEQDEQFKKDFHRVNRPIKRARAKQEMSALRKEAIYNDAAFQQKYGPRTEEGNWYDQLTYGMAAGFNRVGEAANKVLESGVRTGVYKYLPGTAIPALIHRLAVGEEGAQRFQKAAADQFKGAAAIAAEDAKIIDMVAGETQGAPFAKKLGEGAMSLIPSLAGGPAGIWGMAVGGGLHSYGSALADGERAYKAQGFSDEEAFNKALAPALAQGLGTTLITRGFGKTGIESILAPGMKATFKSVGKAFFNGAKYEATEEWWDQLWQSIVRKMTYQPDLTFEQAFQEMAEAGVIGGILGGVVSGVKGVEGEVKSKMLDWQMDKAITESGRAIALEESLPAGFAGEPEPVGIMDTRPAIPNLEADIPDVVGEGQKVTVKYKAPGGGEGIIESGPGTTRDTIQRLLFNAKAGEVTEVRIDTAPEAAPAPEPVVEEAAPEDEFAPTPEEAAMEAEAFPEEVIEEEAALEAEAREEAEGEVRAARLWAQSLTEKGIPNAEEVNRIAGEIRKTSEEAVDAFLNEIERATKAPAPEPVKEEPAPTPTPAPEEAPGFEAQTYQGELSDAQIFQVQQYVEEQAERGGFNPEENESYETVLQLKEARRVRKAAASQGMQKIHDQQLELEKRLNEQIKDYYNEILGEYPDQFKTQLTPDEPLFKQPLNEDDKDREATRPSVVEEPTRAPEGTGAGPTQESVGPEQIEEAPRPDRGPGARVEPQPTAERAEREPGEGGRAGRRGEPDRPEGAEGRAPAPEPAVAEPVEGVGRAAGGELTDPNHSIEPGDEIAPKGKKGKANANLAAIRLLKQLEAENRPASPAEKKVLAQYTGWGGVKEVFEHGKAAAGNDPNWEKDWRPLYDVVRAELGDEEYRRASASILNAHYTSDEVIGEMWEGIRKLGFKGGRVLEPGAGIGHFFGLMPNDLANKSHLTGVEIDNISGRILAKLYPQAKIHQKGFEKANIAKGSMDLIVGNVPFHKDGPVDGAYPKASLHNYYFLRGIDLLKPGGLMVAITSKSTMDNDVSKQSREWLAERADLVGAIRLPNDAFAKNANTQVTTDILIFRKKDGMPFKEGNLFTRKAETKTHKGEPIKVNQYFVDKPDMMLGRLSLEGTLYGGDPEMAVLPHKGQELGPQIVEAFGKLPGEVFGSDTTVNDFTAPVEAAPGMKNNTLVLHEGKVAAVRDDVLVAPEFKHAKTQGARARDFLGVKEVAQAINRLQLDPAATEEQIEVERARLNKVYDAYVKRHGAFNGSKSRFLWEHDVEFPQLAALETIRSQWVPRIDKSGKARTVREDTYHKSDIFNRRTVRPRLAPTSADTVGDALQISLSYKNGLDLGYMGGLLGITADKAKQSLLEQQLAFENPDNGRLETPEEYLSGHVKDKLRQAREAARDNPAYERNVAELEAVQPAPIPLEKIGFRIGSQWISPKIIEGFVQDVLGTPSSVIHVSETGHWKIQARGYARSSANEVTYGFPAGDKLGTDLINAALNMKQPAVWVSDPSDPTGKKRMKDRVLTRQAQLKLDEIQLAFTDWALKKPEVAQELFRDYNERFNGTVDRVYREPAWRHYPGAADQKELYPSQKRAVSRILQGNTLLAHQVGTGKTYTMVTAAMEMRRLGIANKPMIVALNSTVEQFSREFRELYPQAKVLVPTENQRDAKNRQRLMAMINTGDWDAVIIPHSFLEKMPDDPKREEAYINEEKDELQAALIQAKAAEGGRSVRATTLESAIKRLDSRLDELQKRKVDEGMTFEQLGVDAMFVDEAHQFKKLSFASQMETIKGLDRGASKRASSLFLKSRWVMENNDGKNFVLATGTPVSNTIAEAWTMIRYLSPETLKKFEMERFDSFAGMFGNTTTEPELTAGGQWKLVQRFASFQNLPEFRRAWRTVADQVWANEVEQIKLPPLKGGEVQNVVLERTKAVEEQIAKIQQMLEEFEKMTGRERRENSHIPLVATGLAKKATIDMRLIDPSLPDDPGSKVNKVVENVLQRYHATADNLGTQCIFCQNVKTHIEGLEPHEQFNVYEEIKAKLMEGGVPEHEIAFVTGGMKSAEKRVFGEKMNSGQVRIAIGMTETLGTGLNIQERMAALHHLDAPWRPQDIEQRNGRISRQGNMYATLGGVEILTYGMEQTLDAAIYQKLMIKAQATESLLRGDDEMRVSDDAANEVEMSYEEQLAAFSGDERTLQRVGLGQTLRTLEMARSSFASQQAKAREDIVKYEEELIPQLEERLEHEQELVARIPDKVDSVEVEGNTYTDRKAIRIALDDYITKQTAEAKAKQSKGVGAVVTVHHAAPPFKVNGELLKATVKGSYDPNAGDWAKGPDGKPAVQIQYQYENPVLMSLVANFKSGQGFLQSMDSKLKEFQMRPEHTARELEGYRNNLPTLHDAVNKEWQRQKEYDDAVQKMALLDAEIKEEQEASEKVLQAENRGKAGLDQIDEQQKRGMKIEPGGGRPGEAGFVNFNILADLAIKGADLMRKGFTHFVSWSGAMKRVFGDRVGRWLKNVWNKVQRQNHAKALNLSPEGLAAKHRIERKREVDEEEKPDYAEERHRSWLRDYVTRQSKKVIYHGSPDLLLAQQGLNMQHNYDQAAVKRQGEQLEEQLWKSRPEGWSLPGFLRSGPWKRRIKDFKGVSLPLAAHLNVTGRDSEGNFIFEPFEMRAGLMSKAQFDKGEHDVGDMVMVSNPLTGEQDQLYIDKYIETPDGRRGFQLIREMPAHIQQELYNHFTTDEFPEFGWFIDMYIDPALKDTRQTVGGVEIPVFNRFALAAMMAENNPNFDPLDAYTPDVLVSRSLFGAIRKVLQLRTGTRSAGRKYKTGKSREEGKVLDLLSGFNVRALQAIQERSRKRWLKQVIKHGKAFKGTHPPEGWVSLEQGVPEIWAAIKKVRGWNLPKDPITGEAAFPETEMRLQEQAEEDAFKEFMGEAFRLRGKQVAIPRPLLDVLVKQYASQQAHGPLYNTLTWMLRNSKILFLGDPITIVGNIVANDFFNLEAGFRYSTVGALKMLALDPKNAALNFRRARNLFVGQVFNRFMGARKYLPGPNSNFREAIETVLPDEIFADSTRLQDLKIKYDDKWWNLLKQGELGGASMALVKYGNIDIRAKQRFAYAMLRADAVTQGKAKGLRGKALKSFVNEFMANPPMDARLTAINAAQLEMLNYADSPDFINDIVKNDFGALISAFPRFGAAYINKQGDRAAGLKRFIRGVPQGQRAEALADVVTFSMFGAGAIGLVGAAALALLRGDDEPPEDAREVVGTSDILVDDGLGNLERKRIDPEFITANRMNISKWGELAGIDLDDDRDFWLRVRQYPVIGMAGAAVLAQNDYRKHGAAVAAETYARHVTELGGEFLSLGVAFRVPFKALADWQAGEPSPTPVDPYAGGVPFKFYVTDELMGAFIPGQRQFDRVIAWVDPVYKRTRQSERMGYDPGPLEAIRASHLTGLIDRIGAQRGAWDPMLPKGKVETEISLVPSKSMRPDRIPLWVEAQKLRFSDSAAERARVNQYKSVRNLTKPATGWKYRTEADKLALIPQENLVEIPLESRISSLFGVNLRAFDKKGYAEAIDTTLPPLMPPRPPR